MTMEANDRRKPRSKGKHHSEKRKSPAGSSVQQSSASAEEIDTATSHAALGDRESEQEAGRTRKRPRKQNPIDHRSRKHSSSNERDDDDSEEDEDDEYLERAAAAWAENQGAELKTQQLPLISPTETTAKHATANSSAREDRDCWSVHVTQIPFTATQLDLHHFFSAGGCVVSSVRMVYDRGIDRSRQFRGVAFADLVDEASFRCALKLDKSVLLGRKINVRPTRTATELSAIVRETQEKVAHKIRSSKEQQDQEKAAKPKPSAHKKTMATKGAAPSAASSAVTSKGDRKLTKKERNRRAAILRQKGKKGR